MRSKDTLPTSIKSFIKIYYSTLKDSKRIYVSPIAGY
jgi:hypothetical protein